jgi:hypothetical protein
MTSTVTGALATAAVVLILLAGHLDRGSCRRRRPSRGVRGTASDTGTGHAPSDGGSGSSC